MTAVKTAASELQAFYGRAAILFPGEATVKWYNFDPCRAVQPIATVRIPGIWQGAERVFSYTISDGDHV